MEAGHGLGPDAFGAEGEPVVRLEGGKIEVLGSWMGWDIDALIAGAEWIDGLPFASLEAVLAWKRAYGRPKDLEHVRLIEGYLRDESAESAEGCEGYEVAVAGRTEGEARRHWLVCGKLQNSEDLRTRR